MRQILLLAARFTTGVRCEVAHLTVSFPAVNPLDFFNFEMLATGRISFSAARFATGARCEGGAYYCLVSVRQQPSQNFFRAPFRWGEPAVRHRALQPYFVAFA